MVQNKSHIIDLLAGNLANAIVHNILEASLPKVELMDKYRKESLSSFAIAKHYREKLNPPNNALPEKDTSLLREKILRKVNAELNLRVERGYKRIKFELVEPEVEKALKSLLIL